MSRISGLILAGGLGRRMGGVDKGLQLLRGRPMAAWVLERLRPQVSEVLINANQNLEAYAALGARVITDQLTGYAGPLAGLQAGLNAASGDLILSVPCDSPLLPLDLASRMLRAREVAGADLAVARTGEQAHPVFCLCPRRLAAHLEAFLAADGRKIDRWYASLNVAYAEFGDEEAAFRNVNTREELQALEGDAQPPEALRR